VSPVQNEFSVITKSIEGIVQEVHNDPDGITVIIGFGLIRTKQKGLPTRLEEILEPDLDKIQR
jgi:hypothetical protein